MPIAKGVSVIPNNLRKVKPTAGNTTNLAPAAESERKKLLRTPENVKEPPIEISAKGKVTIEMSSRLLLIKLAKAPMPWE